MTSPLIRTAATALATTALVAAGMTVATAATNDVTCSGSTSATTVAGDLVVPSGADCRFTGGSVAGRVVVRDHASLSLQSTTVTGGIVASGTGSVSLDDHTEVAGLITMNRAAVKPRDARTGGLIAIHASRVGGVHVAGKAAALPAMVEVRVLEGSTVSGGVNAAWSDVSVAGSTIQGNLNVTGGGVGTVELTDGTVGGGFYTDNFDTQVVCSSTVNGSARFNQVSGLYVGDNPAGLSAPCAGNTFKGSLTADNGQLGVFVDNRVGGVARGSSNDQFVLRRNTFNGGTTGDFAGGAQTTKRPAS